MASEPFWMNALRSAAGEGALMRDTQVIPIVNDGTLGAVLDYIDHLTTQLAEVTRERDALVRAIDDEMTNTHLGVFDAGDDPKTAINQLMVWSQGTGAYFAEQERDTLAQTVERVRHVCNERLIAMDQVHASDIIAALTPTQHSPKDGLPKL